MTAFEDYVSNLRRVLIAEAQEELALRRRLGNLWESFTEDERREATEIGKQIERDLVRMGL